MKLAFFSLHATHPRCKQSERKQHEFSLLIGQNLSPDLQHTSPALSYDLDLAVNGSDGGRHGWNGWHGDFSKSKQGI